MKPIVKKLLTVALMIAVLGYTIFNYIGGKISIPALCIACFIIGYPMINIITSIIGDLRER